MRIQVQMNVFGRPAYALLCLCPFVILCFCLLMSLGETSSWIRVYGDVQHINDNTEQVQK